MKRDTYKISRDLGKDINLDIIYKKSKLMEIFQSDPDIMTILRTNIDSEDIPEIVIDDSDDSEPVNTEKEGMPNGDYIIDYLKLNGTQTQKNNYICYDWYTERSSYDNEVFRRDYLIVMILIKENDIKSNIPINIEVRRTHQIEDYADDINIDDIDIEDEVLRDLEYRKRLKQSERNSILKKEDYYIPKTDLLAYIIQDLLSWSNVLGEKLICFSDEPKIVDTGWYCRELRFVVNAPNFVPGHPGRHNKYDFI